MSYETFAPNEPVMYSEVSNNLDIKKEIEHKKIGEKIEGHSELGRCWLINPRKTIMIDSGRLISLNRAIWVYVRKETLHEGFFLFSFCNVQCCNPDHMEVLDMETYKKQISSERLFCKQGHRVVGENVYLRPNGDKECLICKQGFGRTFTYRDRQEEKGYAAFLAQEWNSFFGDDIGEDSDVQS